MGGVHCIHMNIQVLKAQSVDIIFEVLFTITLAEISRSQSCKYMYQVKYEQVNLESIR